MSGQLIRILLITILLVSQKLLFGQAYQGREKPVKTYQKAGNCTPPTTTTYMELNNVRAMVHTAGNLWQVPNQNYSQYEVPKNSGRMALFTAALWLGGTDVNNQLKLAALRYRNGQDYWTGPLSNQMAETSYENCDKYDRHFTTTQDDVRTFKAWFDAGLADAANGTNTQSTLFPGYKVPLIIKEWPAHGDVSQGQDYYLAPFFDRDQDGNYDWQNGDYPWYDLDKTKDCKTDRRVSLYGDINFWWVMNDKGNIHTETGADPIGMEIRAQAFAFASNDEVNNMTFYNYELINRGTQTLYNTYFGFFTDGALGDPYDDYVGCDVNRGLAYYYNGDNYDGDNSGFLGYGNNPPAVGVDFFEGPYQDNDNIDNAFGIGVNEALNGIGYGDGIIDNERFGMRRFLYYSNTTNGSNPAQTDPINAVDYYQYLRGYWKDGTPFYYGGSGHLSDAEADPNTPCAFMFPGDTDPLGWGTNGIPQLPWTEYGSNNPPNDRRFLQSAGPFILKPGAVNNITVGVVYARASSGNPFESVKLLQKADDKAQALFENCFKVLDGPHAPELSAQELNKEVVLYLYNPANSNNYLEQYTELDPFIFTTEPNADKAYRFQGYQIFQLKTKDVSLSDIENPNKARLVAQCDLKDGISRIINFEYDEDLEASIPVEKVNGENKGIQHSFRFTEDAFAQGDRRLVNFKKYYYLALSYATNNYKTYNPNDPQSLDGQKKIYLPSRKAAQGEVKVIEVVPHNPTPEADGTLQRIAYGSSPRITRLDGFGNGFRSLELTKETAAKILAEGYDPNPVYDYGAGPINIKVVDPLNLANGYFECKFRDYNTSNSNGADTAKWTVYRYDRKGGNLLDSVLSETMISNNNEQIIPNWGISVQIYQEKYYGNAAVDKKVTDMIGDPTIYFADSSKTWLTGIPDNDAFYPTNWIRSGTYASATTDCITTGPDYLNPCNYNDEATVDDNKAFAKLLGGTIAPHRLAGYQSSFMPMAYYNMPSPGSSRNNASISFLPSVNIIITNDKSKWTRCPVIETGRDAALTQGGAAAGALRKAPSVDKEGNPDGTGNGMGWFPGYAIDLESGARLYMAFGENSFLANDGGSDMVWNPSDRVVDGNGNPVMGGVQPIYVFSYKLKTTNNYSSTFDFPAYVPSEGENLATNMAYQKMLQVEANNNIAKREFYGSISWVAYPLRIPGRDHMATDVTMKLRVNKEYKNFVGSGENNGKPMYSWSMDDISTVTASKDQLAEALKMINVVPNPYYAFSEYERNRLDVKVKIVNLPEVCTVKIYSSNGKLIRTFKKDSPVTSLDWDLNNNKAIPVASGVYLIHVEVPGVGETVVKFFGGVRQTDLQGI